MKGSEHKLRQAAESGVAVGRGRAGIGSHYQVS